MDAINNQNNVSQADVLNLETLYAQYDNLLIQYKQAVADYITHLNSNPSSQTAFTHIRGQAYWGTGQAGTQAAYNVPDVNSCSALCSRTTGCTGATFNPKAYANPMCQLRTGDSNPVVSSASDYAIIPREKEVLFNMKYINEQLTHVNQLIMSKINDNIPAHENQIVQRSQKNSELLANFKKLTDERKKINNMVNEYDGLDSAQNEGDLRANQNYYHFLLLVVIAIFFIILFFRFATYLPSVNTDGYGGAFGGDIFNIILGVVFIIFIYYAFIRNIL